jgi:hypothetical protein
MRMSRKIARAALEQSIPGTLHKVARSPRQSDTVSGKEQERLSIAFVKKENGRRMRSDSKISRGRDREKAAPSGELHRNSETDVQCFEMNRSVTRISNDRV